MTKLVVFLLPYEIFAPRWLSEGIAVYNESKNGFGRNNSAIFASKMRGEVYRGLRSFTEESYEGYYNSRWPFGQVYLYGSDFFQFVKDKYGEKKVVDYIENYNSNIIPFRMDSRSRETFGISSAKMWAEFQAYLTKKFNPQIAQIKTAPNQQIKTGSSPLC